MKLGKLKQIWRYPVKSMGGEPVVSAVIGRNGLAGDRCWAVINAESNEITNAKRWPELLNYRATLQAADDLQSSGYDDDVPDVDVHCPNGDVFGGRGNNSAELFSANLGKQVRLVPLADSSNRNHYRLARKRTPEIMAQELLLLEDEAYPDFSGTPKELAAALSDCVTPPGTYVDAFPLHMMTTNSLQYLSEKGNVDAITERYRPNLLVEPSEQLAEMTENSWVDCRVQVGEAILRIHSRTVRCSMPSREQQWCGAKAEKKMMRAVVDHCDRHLGVNIFVEKGGLVSTDQDIVLLT